MYSYSIIVSRRCWGNEYGSLIESELAVVGGAESGGQVLYRFTELFRVVSIE